MPTKAKPHDALFALPFDSQSHKNTTKRNYFLMPTLETDERLRWKRMQLKFFGATRTRKDPKNSHGN